MTIEKNTVVELTYNADVDGMIVDSASTGNPLGYIHGTGMLLPAFEENIEGKTAGDRFEFTLAPELAYGAWDASLKFDIPKTAFMSEGKLREDLLVPGRLVPMFNSEGQVCHARICEVKEEKVTVDFNHPMAGKTMHFTGTVISVREATKKELTEGLHGEFLPQEECGHCCHGGGGCHGEGGCHGGGGCHGEEEGGCHGEGGHCHCHE